MSSSPRKENSWDVLKIAFRYLTPNEILQVLNYHFENSFTELPTDWEKMIDEIAPEPGKPVHCILADAAIAWYLQSNLQIHDLPGENIVLDSDKISVDDPERIARISRITESLNNNIEIIPIKWIRGDPDTDFSRMIDSVKYRNSLFIFNDNEEQFLAFEKYGNKYPQACSPGGGNAAIRGYQCYNAPRACGIPTGYDGKGYKNLQEKRGKSTAQGIIDRALERVRFLLYDSGIHYNRLFFSGGNAGEIGTGIFVVGDDVKKYIYKRLHDITDLQYPSNRV